MTTRVLLKIPKPTHAAYNIIADNAPSGYVYQKEFHMLYEQNGEFFRQAAKILYRNPRLRDILLISRERLKKANQVTSDYSLVFSLGPYSAFNSVPTILFLEDAGDEVVNKSALQRNMLLHGGIKKILCGNPAAAKTFLGILTEAEFEHLVGVVRPGIPLPPPVQRRKSESTRLLFVASGNYSHTKGVAEMDYSFRGGRELLSAFRLLNERFGKKVSLTVVGVIPQSVLAAYSDVLRMENVRVTGRILPRKDLDQIYADSDIFLYPGYRGPWLTIAEAFSYGLPAVGSDTWDVPEYISDGVSGTVVHRDDGRKVTMVNFKPIWDAGLITSGPLDETFVIDYAEAVSRLIEDSAYRERLGTNARRAVEQGVFSLDHMRSELGRYFDEALQK